MRLRQAHAILETAALEQALGIETHPVDHDLDHWGAAGGERPPLRRGDKEGT